MSIIIPYDEKLANSAGGFITSQGKIIYTGFSCHEGEAARICKGSCYDSISNFLYRNKTNQLYYSGELNEVLKEYGVTRVEDLDKYATSELSKEELIAFKKWAKLVTEDDSFEVFFREMYSGFLHRFLRWDIFETIRRRVITTTSPFYHTKYFEWLVMGYRVDQVCFFKFNDKGEVEVVDPSHEKAPGWIHDFHEDERYRETLNRIEKENWSRVRRLEYLKEYKETRK